MAIKAPLSNYKKKNLLIISFLLLGAAVIFGYDGYLSQYEWSMRHSFYEDHMIDGVPDSDMMFNRKAPPVFAAAGVAMLIYYFVFAAKRKVIADEAALIVNTETIPYGSIEKINKTYFDSKGYFIVTYKDNSGQSKDVKVSDRTYDNLPAVLDHLVSKISG
jgi:hypothetical protein